nr:HEPN domain-containing protein [Pyrobaculum neutrophilum]
MKKGGYPRTHSLRRLIRELGEVEPQALELVNNIAYLHYVARLEEAYIASRYLPVIYEEAETTVLPALKGETCCLCCQGPGEVCRVFRKSKADKANRLPLGFRRCPPPRRCLGLPFAGTTALGAG